MLSKEAILEFQRIYKKTYRVDIPYSVAEEKAFRLLTLFKSIYKAIPLKGDSKENYGKS